MKIYAIKYNIMVGTKTEHRSECFTEITEFLERVKYLSRPDKYYISDIEVYSGVLEEIAIDKVLNPF